MSQTAPLAESRFAVPAHWRAARPFATVAALATIAGGLIAAAAAHAPSRPLVWMVAYLVLVAGAAQMALGAGRALLAAQAPGKFRITVECALLNLGNAGVVIGTLAGSLPVAAAGVLAFIASLALFLDAVRGASRDWRLTAYRGLLALLFASSLVGLVLAARH